MVRLEEHKSPAQDYGIEKLPPPKQVFIPLVQHIGKPNSPTVKVGDEVDLGQQIASCQAAVSSPIHASVSGRITAIKNWPHPVAGMCRAIVIDNDGKDALPVMVSPAFRKTQGLDPDDIRRIVHQAGIVGMGGAGFPTQIKLSPPKPVDTFILNGAECEPYSTGDYRLMIERTKQILKGVELVVRCLGIRRIFIAIEDNKPQAIKAFSRELKALNIPHCRLRVLKSTYPQGGEKQLIKNILNREVASGKLPFDVGVLVHNVGTVLAIYQAVYQNKSFYERVVTVGGDCLSNPKNLLVRIGTPIKELIEFCQPLKQQPAKIIIGGPMMGIAQYSEMTPIIKTSTAVILLSARTVQPYTEDSCIRCGECVRNCPAGLQPCLISLAAERKNWDLAKTYSPLDCIECGLCAYLCPAKRNLVQSIKLAKMEAQ